MTITTEIMQQIMPVLNSIGEKLGTTGAHLWEILVRQAFVEGIINIGYILISAAILFAIYKIDKWAFKKYLTPLKNIHDDNFGWLALIIVSCLPIGLITAFGVCSFHDAVTGLANPEYAAFTDITDRLGHGGH